MVIDRAENKMRTEWNLNEYTSDLQFSLSSAHHRKDCYKRNVYKAACVIKGDKFRLVIIMCPESVDHAT